jgi:hypothetical protein
MWWLALLAAVFIGPPAPPPVDFQREIKPILTRCTPCHFPGGTMYAKLPFDRPATVTLLGEKLFTRIKKEEERAVIRRFLEGTPPSPAAGPAASRRRW